jgi:hypothetical protein
MRISGSVALLKALMTVVSRLGLVPSHHPVPELPDQVLRFLIDFLVPLVVIGSGDDDFACHMADFIQYVLESDSGSLGRCDQLGLRSSARWTRSRNVWHPYSRAPGPGPIWRYRSVAPHNVVVDLPFLLVSERGVLGLSAAELGQQIPPDPHSTSLTMREVEAVADFILAAYKGK